jgi:hypothetical protein
LKTKREYIITLTITATEARLLPTIEELNGDLDKIVNLGSLDRDLREVVMTSYADLLGYEVEAAKVTGINWED